MAEVDGVISVHQRLLRGLTRIQCLDVKLGGNHQPSFEAMVCSSH